MDQSFQENRGPVVKEKRKTSLLNSLSSLRVTGKADVKIVCGKREFPAHSLVLEASSTYFRTMLNCKLKEATTRQVIFNDIDPEVMELLLDFLYLGEVEQLENIDEVQALLSAAHMMQLEELVEYCWDMLTASLSVENLMRIQDIVEEYENRDIEVNILNYVVANLSEVLESSQFCSLPRVRLEALLLFMNSKRLCMDKLLLGLCRWLMKSLGVRKVFVNDLFDTIEVHLLSNSCLKSLLEWKELTESSKEIEEKLKELELRKGASLHHLPVKTASIKDVNCLKTRLTFISEFRRKEVYDPNEDLRILRNVQRETLQQLDLNSMTWLTVQDLPFTGYKGAAICQHDTQIYLAGGKLCPAYVMFDPNTNVLDHPGYSRGVDAIDAGMCYYRDNLYILGGYCKDGGTPNNRVLFITIGSQTWIPTKSLAYRRANPTVITSQDHIYVGGGSNYEARCNVEMSWGSKNQLHWETLYLPHTPNRVVGLHCFVVESVLHGLYYVNGELIHMKYVPEANKLVSNKSVLGLAGITKVFSPAENSDKVFVSVSVGFQIPDYIWKPETDDWIILCETAKGKCEIPEDEAMQRSYIVYK